MSFRHLISGARTVAADVSHKLIDLGKLDLEAINFSNLPEGEALKQSVEKAKEKKLSGFVVQFNGGSVRVIAIKTAEIAEDHPQIVRKINGSGYCVMRSHLAV